MSVVLALYACVHANEFCYAAHSKMILIKLWHPCFSLNKKKVFIFWFCSNIGETRLLGHCADSQDLQSWNMDQVLMYYYIPYWSQVTSLAWLSNFSFNYYFLIFFFGWFYFLIYLKHRMDCEQNKEYQCIILEYILIKS